MSWNYQNRLFCTWIIAHSLISLSLLISYLSHSDFSLSSPLLYLDLLSFFHLEFQTPQTHISHACFVTTFFGKKASNPINGKIDQLNKTHVLAKIHTFDALITSQIPFGRTHDLFGELIARNHYAATIEKIKSGEISKRTQMIEGILIILVDDESKRIKCINHSKKTFKGFYYVSYKHYDIGWYFESTQNWYIGKWKWKDEVDGGWKLIKMI